VFVNNLRHIFIFHSSMFTPFYSNPNQYCILNDILDNRLLTKEIIKVEAKAQTRADSVRAQPSDQLTARALVNIVYSRNDCSDQKMECIQCIIPL
jgi:hypothetical protein